MTSIRSTRVNLTTHGLDRLAVDPTRRLMFCAIEKCAQSLQLTLLRALAGRPKPQWPFDMAPNAHGADAAAVASWIFNDDSWTRVVVFRDPVERFVSAYNSKCRLQDADGKQHCNRLFQIKQADITVDSVLDALEDPIRRVKAYTDFHWRPQSWACGGIHRFVDRFRTVPFSNLQAGLCEIIDCKNLTSLFERRYGVDRHITNASANALTRLQVLRVRQFYRFDEAFFADKGIRV